MQDPCLGSSPARRFHNLIHTQVEKHGVSNDVMFLFEVEKATAFSKKLQLKNFERTLTRPTVPDGPMSIP